MIQRSGHVVMHLLANVQQATIGPFLIAAIAPGTTVYTDEYDIYGRLKEWGYQHRTVNHGRGGICSRRRWRRIPRSSRQHEGGCWSLLRSWLRPHCGISKEKLPLYVGFFQFVHNARQRGKALLESLVATLVARPPRIAG